MVTPKKRPVAQDSPRPKSVDAVPSHQPAPKATKQKIHKKYLSTFRQTLNKASRLFVQTRSPFEKFLYACQIRGIYAALDATKHYEAVNHLIETTLLQKIKHGYLPCEKCHGKGYFGSNAKSSQCKICNGRGYRSLKLVEYDAPILIQGWQDAIKTISAKLKSASTNQSYSSENVTYPKDIIYDHQSTSGKLFTQLTQSALVICPTCHGGKIIYCTKCNNSGKINCYECGGRGYQKTCSCRYRCNHCEGKGKIKCSRCPPLRGSICKSCSGAGFRPACTQCNGTGLILCTSCNNTNPHCSKCRGTGFVLCRKCNGAATARTNLGARHQGFCELEPGCSVRLGLAPLVSRGRCLQ